MTVIIRKNIREQIRIERQDYKGHDLINMRVWYDDGSGEYCPGKQGIAFRTELVGDIQSALSDLVNLEEAA